MNPRAVLLNPEVCPSVAWAATKALLGPVDHWEAESLRIELERRLGEVPEALAVKVLAAQTIATTFNWAWDHQAVFAFALACDGVSVGHDDVLQPTVEQLCWAMREVDALAQPPWGPDHGFDPDEVDAAVAVLLVEEGFADTPPELAFCRDVFAGLSPASVELRRQTRAAREALDAVPLDRAREIAAETGEDELGVQVRRMVDVRAYVEERLDRRTRQHAQLLAA